MTPVMPNYGPIPKLENFLEEAIKTNYWFYAVVFTAMEVEKYGCDKIRFYLNSFKDNKPSFTEAILERISLLTVAKCLLELEFIDKEDYKIITELNAERNACVHRTSGDPHIIGTEATKKLEPLIKKAVTILKEKLDAEKLFAYC
jgi:hypothetical protein